MALTRSIHLSEAEPACLHYLQGCKIKFDGDAPVSEYFKPAALGTQTDGAPVLEASFRGRNLKGQEITLPEGYRGAVLEKREGCNDSGEPSTSWHAKGTFNTFTYWNHDTAPVPTDGARRAMEWAALASHTHKPIDPTEVAKEMETAGKAADGVAKPEETK